MADNKQVTIHNVKVETIETILATFQLTDFIDITLVPGVGNAPDLLRISPSGFDNSTVTEWFDFKRINDFI